MVSSDPSTESNSKKFKEMRQYLLAFSAAFDEFHAAVVSRNGSQGRYIRSHHDYPTMRILDGGFPIFHEIGNFSEAAPRDYVSAFRPRGLIAAALGRYGSPEQSFPKGQELVDFLRAHEIGARLSLSAPDGQIRSAWRVERMVADAVERYIHLHGIDSPVESNKRMEVILPLAVGTASPRLPLRLVVPIAMTHFELDHFRLTETTYVTRIPRKMQLARARMSTLGSGAVQMVVGAATHAFVSTDWHLEVGTVKQVAESLGHSSDNVIEAIDSFFGSLRLVTGISTGYAQLLWIPKGWALEYFCDLTPVFGTTLRQYPSEYDAYGWVERGSTVSKEQLKDLKRIYGAIVESRSERIRLAVRRLNSCLTRSDAADAILDGVIGLELLLGDDRNQSLSYKLRLRAGILAVVHPKLGDATDVASRVKKLYAARSNIVHGLTKRQSKEASDVGDTRYAEERQLASELLRFILDALLTYPAYLDTAKIDQELLLRGADAAPQSGDGVS